MAVHQLVPTFVMGDATGQAAVNLRWLLRRMGIHGELYSADVAPDLHALVRPISHLCPREDDLVLYHHGIASWLSGTWLHLRCRKGVVFHNVTPARMLAGTPVEEALVSGRAQLAAMAHHADVALGDSELNALELRDAGFRNIHVIPIVVEPGALRTNLGGPRMATRLASSSGPTVLTVCRVVPNKRVEDLQALHAATPPSAGRPAARRRRLRRGRALRARPAADGARPAQPPPPRPGLRPPTSPLLSSSCPTPS